MFSNNKECYSYHNSSKAGYFINSFENWSYKGQPYSQDQDMALWAQTQQLTGNFLQQVNDLYATEQFPYEVRHSIAHWLEAQPWTEVSNAGDSNRASYLVDMMVQKIKEQTSSNMYNSCELFPCRLRLVKSAEIIEMLYTDNPLEFTRLISSCLGQEAQLVRLGLSPVDSTANSPEVVISKNEHTISTELSQLKNLVHEVVREVDSHKDLQEYLVLKIQECNSLKGNLKYYEASRDQLRANHLRVDIERIDKDLRDKAPKLMHSRNVVQDMLNRILQQFSAASRKILEEELYSWKDSQRRSAYKVVYTEPHHINKIQKWCEDLGCILSDCQQQLIKLEMAMEAFPANHEKSTLNKLKEDISRHLHYVLQRSFVVDWQPPQVVKKDARFSATVRLLVGNQQNLFVNIPTVEANIINELQARALVQEQALSALSVNSGSILNGKGTMEGLQGQFGATFRNMQLKKIKRSDRKGQELVVEEKFCILFHSKLQVGQHWHDIWTLSLPLVVTVHGNQECQAQATILWDNAFSPLHRVPFVVSEQVTWSDLSQVLSSWFGHKTGAPLKAEHLHYLAAKLFGDNQTDISGSLISRTTFHKDQLQMRSMFTFWEWIFAIHKVVKDPLRELWNNGLIMGFISKRTAQELLMSKPPGTFLLRFSDSELGGISVVYSCRDEGTNNSVYVCNLSPFTDKDFRIRSLANRVKDIETLKCLYPDIPKDQAFGKHWSPDLTALSLPPHPDEYIKHTLSMKIPGMPPDVSTLSLQPTTTSMVASLMDC